MFWNVIGPCDQWRFLLSPMYHEYIGHSKELRHRNVFELFLFCKF